MDLVTFIMKECPQLEFRGLMTMGKVHDIDGFKLMYELKRKLIDTFSLDEASFILSMGTSADFEEAVSKILSSNSLRSWKEQTKSELGLYFSARETTPKRNKPPQLYKKKSKKLTNETYINLIILS